MHAEILSYSRSRGLFAGVSLAGAMLRPDHGANFQFYRHVYEPKEILIDGLATPPPRRSSWTTSWRSIHPAGASHSR